MLFKVIISVYCENRTNHISTNAEIQIVKPASTYRYLVLGSKGLMCVGFCDRA